MKRRKILLAIAIFAMAAVLGGCGKSNGILPDKIENVSTEPTVSGKKVDDEEKNLYPLEYLGGVWVMEGFNQTPENLELSKKTITVKSDNGKNIELLSTPVQLNLMPYKDNPFKECGMGYGEILFKKKNWQDNFFDMYYTVPVVFDTYDNTLALGIISDILVCEEGVFMNKAGMPVDELKIEEFTYEMEWTGWNLTLKQGKDKVNYIPSDIDCGEGVVFGAEDYNLDGPQLACKGMAALHEDYEAVDNIIKVKPSFEERDNIQFSLEKPLEAEWDFRDDGTVVVDVKDKGTYSYDFLYSGRSLVLMNEETTSLYSVYAEKSEENDLGISIGINTEVEAVLSLASYMTDSQSVYIFDDTLLEWLEAGGETTQNLEELLAPGELTDIEMYLDGGQFTIRVINPYDVHIKYWEATVAGIYIDAEKSDIILGMDGNENGIAYGVSDMQEVFDYWREIPFEKGEDYLSYKGAGLTRIKMADFAFSFDGPKTRSIILEDDHEREIKFLFKDGVLSGIERIAPSLLYSGLQDNIVSDELTELTPSYVADVTVVRDTILEKLKKAFEEEEVPVIINEATGEIIMPNDVLFPTNEYELSEAGKKYIDSLMNVYAKVLLSDEFVDVISGIAIDGHCDPTGSDAYNQVLSQNRADSVKQWCIESNTNKLSDNQKQKLTEIATAKGYSFSDPVFNSRGEVDNEASRRVTIKFFIDMEAAMQEAK